MKILTRRRHTVAALATLALGAFIITMAYERTRGDRMEERAERSRAEGFAVAETPYPTFVGSAHGLPAVHEGEESPGARRTVIDPPEGVPWGGQTWEAIASIDGFPVLGQFASDHPGLNWRGVQEVFMQGPDLLVLRAENGHALYATRDRGAWDVSLLEPDGSNRDWRL